MRILAKIEVSGVSIDEIVDKAREEWRMLCGDSSAEIPDGSEIDIQQTDGSDLYVGVVHIRTKVEGK